MNGEIAEPLVRTISTPNISKTIMIGSNQNFLRTLRNEKKSFKNSIVLWFVNKVFQYPMKNNYAL